MPVLPLLLAAAVTGTALPGPQTDLAQARAEADAVIRAAHAEQHFTNATHRKLPAARHNASGLRCLFQPGGAGNQIIYIGTAGRGRGGMGCLSRPAADFRQTLEAVELAPDETLDSVFEKSVLNITFQQPDARPFQSKQEIVVRVEPAENGPRPPEPRTAAYVVRRGDQEVFSRVSVALVNGWIIRQQFEAPAARAEQAELLAGVVMSATLIDLVAREG